MDSKCGHSDSLEKFSTTGPHQKNSSEAEIRTESEAELQKAELAEAELCELSSSIDYIDHKSQQVISMFHFLSK